MRLSTGVIAMIASGASFAQEASTDAVLESLTAVADEVAEAIDSSLDVLDPALSALLAPIMAGWIETARDAAHQRGVAELPPGIREEFAGHLPEEILNRVRWRVDDDPSSVEQWLFRFGDTPALTVDSVVLFANDDVASDPKLWAHELYHVLQFSEWGIDGFVERYLADWGGVEHAASEFRWEWMTATGRVGTR